jgi:hypothetical protein
LTACRVFREKYLSEVEYSEEAGMEKLAGE